MVVILSNLENAMDIKTGYGLTTALFKRHGFTVISEEDFENIKGFDL
jgi:uncharacterized protein YbbK (DUF523 family)